MCLWKLFFSLNIGYDWVMKRWQFRAPWLGVFPRCHFINHRMALPISWFFPDYIDTQNTSLRLPTPEYIYQDEQPPSAERLVRNAKEMFWHWHVTYVWTLWLGEDPGRGMIVMNERHQDDAVTQPRPGTCSIRTSLDQSWSQALGVLLSDYHLK